MKLSFVSKLLFLSLTTDWMKKLLAAEEDKIQTRFWWCEASGAEDFSSLTEWCPLSHHELMFLEHIFCPRLYDKYLSCRLQMWPKTMWEGQQGHFSSCGVLPWITIPMCMFKISRTISPQEGWMGPSATSPGGCHPCPWILTVLSNPNNSRILWVFDHVLYNWANSWVLFRGGFVKSDLGLSQVPFSLSLLYLHRSSDKKTTRTFHKCFKISTDWEKWESQGCPLFYPF